MADKKERFMFYCYHCLQTYRGWSTVSSVQTENVPFDDDLQKNERSESGFDSINDGMFNSTNHDFIHIPLNIPLPPTRKPPEVPIAIGDLSPHPSPMPVRKFHKQPIPDINFIESTPSPVLKGNHGCLIENGKSDESSCESEIKVDELNEELLKRLSNSNARKEGIIADKIMQNEMENLDIKDFPKDRA